MTDDKKWRELFPRIVAEKPSWREHEVSILPTRKTPLDKLPPTQQVANPLPGPIHDVTTDVVLPRIYGHDDTENVSTNVIIVVGANIYSGDIDVRNLAAYP